MPNMARRVLLPVTQALQEGAPNELPTLDTMRERLGGVVGNAEGSGQLALIVSTGKPGVVVHRSSTGTDIMVKRGIVRRTATEDVRIIEEREPHPSIPDDVRAIHVEMQRFAALNNGDRVFVADPRGAAGKKFAATLLEKCRFGAIVQRDDGTPMAIGFARMHPA